MDGTQSDPLTDGPEETSGGRAWLAVVSVAVAAVAAIAAVWLALAAIDESNPPVTAPSGRVEEPIVDVSNFPLGALAGREAPPISVPLFDGSHFTLAEHLRNPGGPLVLNLWASWCTPCRREIPDFSRVANANPEVSFLGVAVEDGRGPAEDFAAAVGASYPLGFDEHLTVTDGYRSIGLPVTYLIGADGIVVRQVQGQLNAAWLQAFIDHDFGS